MNFEGLVEISMPRKCQLVYLFYRTPRNFKVHMYIMTSNFQKADGVAVKMGQLPSAGGCPIVTVNSYLLSEYYCFHYVYVHLIWIWCFTYIFKYFGFLFFGDASLLEIGLHRLATPFLKFTGIYTKVWIVGLDFLKWAVSFFYWSSFG